MDKGAKEGRIAVVIIFMILVIFMSAINHIDQVTTNQIEMVMMQE